MTKRSPCFNDSMIHSCMGQTVCASWVIILPCRIAQQFWHRVWLKGKATMRNAAYFKLHLLQQFLLKRFLNVEDAKTWLENVFFTFLDHLIKFRYVILRYASKQTHIQTHSSQYFAPVSVRNNLHRISVFRLVKFISLGHRLGTHTHRHTRPSALPGSRHFESLLSRRYVEAPRHSGST